MGCQKLIYGDFVTDDVRGKNALFKESFATSSGYYELMRREFHAMGVEINTPDLNIDKDVAFELHVEGRPLSSKNKKKYLIALENPNHNYFNGSQEYCKNFSKIFTWNSHILKLENAIKVLSPTNISLKSILGYSERDIFSCIINANKKFKIGLITDLYIERIEVIRWYEKNAPQHFQLYGRGWDKPAPAFNFIDKINRSIPSLAVKMFGFKYFPSYKGEVISKGDVLQKSKFSYCYENNRDMPNYITEKIIDSFLYGCVPVYWGANNVLEYIPENCFVDRRKFKNTEDVHKHLLSMSPQVYLDYQSNIANFIAGGDAKKFSFENLVSTVVKNIYADLVGPSNFQAFE